MEVIHRAYMQKKLTYRYLCTMFIIEYTSIFSREKDSVHITAHIDLERFFCIYA
jgi:hypothetical protein